ncbi:peptide deformylase, mitochondrial-like [Toxorhynchites rutilus septentrionalis]|uniref:peptide deformylase, mitochondrial-like n=1 Tax=Toxorhynchites rutilus septentrionalis TaxID=329112 RepID=UPI00247A8262|nr:peptide deformylase, mitochondrial-like [Toxorhynchites rutilus septentrionalis]
MRMFLNTRRSFSTTRKVASFAKWYRGLWRSKPANEPPYDHITQVGDPVLRLKATPVPLDAITSPEVKFLVQRMVDVMRKYDGVGLAAPQIGISLRVLVMGFDEKSKKEYTESERKIKGMKTLPLTVLINPEMKIKNYDKICFPEACMSVRGYSAEVTRYAEVSLTGFDETGVSRQLTLEGWNARIAQHEMDHLNGIVYTDVMNPKTFTCTCWEAVNRHHGRVRISFHQK